MTTKLNKDNYHNIEAERDYMSRSQYLKFLDCEAQAMAYLKGEWIDPPSEPLLVGQYVHSWNDNTRRDFIIRHPGMFKKDGSLKAEYKLADKMIATLEADPLCKYMLQGEKEKIYTAEFAGAMWKVMLDVRNEERRRIVDLKTTKSIRETYWDSVIRERVSFVEQYHYPLQAALYCEIERRANGRSEGDWFEFFVVAVSKENVPDKEVIDLRDPRRYEVELETIAANMPRILAIKAGEEKPSRCEQCDYCRSTKVLTGAVHYADIVA